jgi:hypothetical protein
MFTVRGQWISELGFFTMYPGVSKQSRDWTGHCVTSLRPATCVRLAVYYTGPFFIVLQKPAAL